MSTIYCISIFIESQYVDYNRLGLEYAINWISRAVFGLGRPDTIREVTKNNIPILLAFGPVFFVAAIGEYSNMHRLPHLEYEPKFGAIMGILFFVTSLNSDSRPLTQGAKKAIFLN